MKITITATRIKKQQNIQEIFTWNPITRFAIDNTRGLPVKLRIQIAKMSLHNKITDIKLIDINYFDNSIMYLYNIIDTDFFNIPIIETCMIDYNPTLRNKDCKNCQHLKFWNNQFVCYLRMFPTDKLEGCLDWFETETNNLIEIRKRHVYNRKTARRNGMFNK